MFVKVTKKFYGGGRTSPSLKEPSLTTKVVNFDLVKMFGPNDEKDHSKGTDFEMLDGSLLSITENFSDILRITEAKGRWLK